MTMSSHGPSALAEFLVILTIISEMSAVLADFGHDYSCLLYTSDAADE